MPCLRVLVAELLQLLLPELRHSIHGVCQEASNVAVALPPALLCEQAAVEPRGRVICLSHLPNACTSKLQHYCPSESALVTALRMSICDARVPCAA